MALPATAIAQGPVAYQGNPAHTGAASGTTFSAPLGKRWVRRDLGEGPTYPVFAEGRVFLSAGSSVYALDPATGRTIWSRAVRARGVAYDDGKIFLVNENGVMQALSAANGSVVWTALLPGESSSFSPPVAFGGYVHASTPSTVIGVNADTGIRVWSSSAASGSATAPSVDGDKVYTSDGCGKVTAYERRTGTEVYGSDDLCSFGLGTTPVVTGGRVYSGGKVIDALTGLTRDTYAATAPPAFSGGIGYFIDERDVYARDSGGIVRWRHRASTDRYYNDVRIPPFVAGNHVYVIAGTTLMALERGSGRRVWESEMRSGGVGYPEAFGGIGAAGNTLVVSHGNRVIGYSPGPDTPGVDDPDKPPPGSNTLELSASRQKLTFGRSLTLSGRLDLYGATVDIQHDPWPYGRWEHLKTVAPDSGSSGSFSLRVNPQRNARYRAVYTGTHPPTTSDTLTVYTDVASYFRIRAVGKRRIQVRTRAAGPPEAKLRGARIYVYLLRARARAARRIGSVKLRGNGARVRGVKTLRTPKPRRTDLFIACRREKTDDGFGQPDKRLARCGRKLLR